MSRRPLHCSPFYLFAILFLGFLSGYAAPQTAQPTKRASAGARVALVASQQEQQARGAQKYAPGQLLVRFRKGAGKVAARAVHAAVGAEVVREFRVVQNLQLVRLPAGMSVRQAELHYRQRPDVLYAEPNYIRHIDQAQVTPNDPRFAEMWSLHNTGQTGGTPGADIHASQAWATTTGSANVVIGIIDTGIDYNHVDLSANMFRNGADCNSNGVDDDGNGYVDDCYGIDTANGDSDPMDDAGHGTHVAGTIGAAGNNGTGVVGVNWHVSLMACKFLGADGSGSTSDAIKCLDYFAMMKDRGVNIVATNNSYGGGDFSQAEMDAIDAQRQRGILFIASAGNAGKDSDAGPQYPANYYLPNIIAVAATDGNDALASFSNFGRHTVHLGAPGKEILSSMPGSSYGIKSGTSMAAPHVTGVAALLKAQDPSRDWKAIKNLILAGGDPVLSVAKTISQKRLNAHGAMTCSNSTLLTRLQPIPTVFYAWAGEALSLNLAVLHINCAWPNGNVQVSIDGGAETLMLLDDGLGTDQESGDGIYSAQKEWLPSGELRTHTLSFPNGDVITVTLIPLLLPYTYSTAVPFNYRSITGTNLQLDDDAAAGITPPFPIAFGGENFPSLWVNSNGNVTFFEAFAASYDNHFLPASSVRTLVAPFWDDLSPQGDNNVWWEVIGSAPNRELVIEWRDVDHYNCDSGLTVRFQIVFFENSSDILYNYADTVFTDPNRVGSCYSAVDKGASATVGEQSMANAATQFSFNTPSLADNTAILWQLAYPVPAIERLSPFTGFAGSPDFTLDVFGSGFFPQSVVYWNGSPRSTTFASNRQLRATISAGDVVAAGTAQVSVVNPSPGGGASNSSPFTIYNSYPPPTLTSMSRSVALAPSESFTLTVTGTGFVSASVVRWNGSDRPTTVVSSTTAQAEISYRDVAGGGLVPITVFSPAPGGGTSEPQTFTVLNSAPLIAGISPSLVVPGAGFTLTVASAYRFLNYCGNDPCTGTFVPASVVRWNGADRPTTFLHAARLEAVIPASDVAAASTAEITVFNPAPGGGVSAPVTLSIVGPPANDNFASATPITSTPFTHTIDTRTATSESSDPISTYYCGLVGPKSVWYKFTPSANMTLFANTAGTIAIDYSFEPVLSVWIEAGGALSLVTCGTPFSPTGFAVPAVNFQAAAGTTYYFLVASYPFLNNATGGTLVFNLDGAPTTYQLAVTRAGSGSGTVTSTPAGINCGATCSASFNSGTVVTLNATPANGSQFVGWGGACSGTGGCSVMMDAAKSVAASFSDIAPGVTLSPSSLTFLPQIVGSTSPPQPVTLTNSGNSPLTISGMTFGGPSAGHFTKSDNCGASLNAGASCTISVTTHPTDAGACAASLAIADNAPGSPQIIPLSGMGVDFSVSPGSGSPTSATVNAGQVATYSLSLAGTTGFSGSVSLACSGAPNAASCSVSPSTLNLSGTTPVAATVTVTTTARAALPPLGGPFAAPPPSVVPLALTLLLALTALLFLAVGFRSRRFVVRAGAFALTTVFALLLLSSCGGGGSSAPPTPPSQSVGTQPGTYTITVTATSGGASRSLPLTLTVR